jgi:Fe-S-cluster containining protein
MSDAVTTSLISPRELLRQVRLKTMAVGEELRSFADEVATSHGKRVECKRGCDNCCKQKVIVTEAEGVAIYIYLRSEGRWSDELEARLAEEDVHATRTNHSDWFKEKRPCPFLRDGECGVYAVRPISCAATFAINDPSFCGMPDVPPGLGQMQINSPFAPASKDLILFMLSVEAGLGVDGFMTLPAAALAAARRATKREPRRALVVQLHDGVGELIERFDREGAAFDFEATT